MPIVLANCAVRNASGERYLFTVSGSSVSSRLTFIGIPLDTGKTVERAYEIGHTEQLLGKAARSISEDPPLLLLPPTPWCLQDRARVVTRFIKSSVI